VFVLFYAKLYPPQWVVVYSTNIPLPIVFYKASIILDNNAISC
jgi:hypothetical protein